MLTRPSRASVGQVGGVLEPAQHHHRLHERCRGPLPRPPIVQLAVRAQPARHLGHGARGNVEGGTIGDHVGSWLRVDFLVETNPRDQDPTPASDTPVTSAVTSVTLVRKPHCTRRGRGE